MQFDHTQVIFRTQRVIKRTKNRIYPSLRNNLNMNPIKGLPYLHTLHIPKLMSVAVVLIIKNSPQEK